MFQVPVKHIHPCWHGNQVEAT